MANRIGDGSTDPRNAATHKRLLRARGLRMGVDHGEPGADRTAVVEVAAGGEVPADQVVVIHMGEAVLTREATERIARNRRTKKEE